MQHIPEFAYGDRVRLTLPQYPGTAGTVVGWGFTLGENGVATPAILVSEDGADEGESVVWGLNVTEPE